MIFRIYFILLALLPYYTFTSMHEEYREINNEIVLPNEDLFFQSPKKITTKEIIECSGNLIFENKQGDFKKYEFKNLPSDIKITLFQALINKDGYTYKTKDSLLFQRWVHEENWLDGNYVFCNIPLQLVTARHHLCGRNTKIHFMIDPYPHGVAEFYPANSVLHVNCNQYVQIAHDNFHIMSEIYTDTNETFEDLSNFEKVKITIQNLHNQDELIPIFEQLEKINIANYITKIILCKTLLIDDNFIRETLKLPDLENLQYLKYANSDNKIRIITNQST